MEWGGKCVKSLLASILDSHTTHLVLFKDTPFLALAWLRSFFVITPLDGISHGRHFLLVIVRTVEVGEKLSEGKGQ